MVIDGTWTTVHTLEGCFQQARLVKTVKVYISRNKRIWKRPSVTFYKRNRYRLGHKSVKKNLLGSMYSQPTMNAETSSVSCAYHDKLFGKWNNLEVVGDFRFKNQTVQNFCYSPVRVTMAKFWTNAHAASCLRGSGYLSYR